MLDFGLGQPGLLRDDVEADDARAGWSEEDRLDERHQADLLPQERMALLQYRLTL